MADNRPKHELLNSEEIGQVITTAPNVKRYEETALAVKKAEIAKTVAWKSQMLKDASENGRVKLSDDNMEAVQDRCEMYLNTCALNGCCPTMHGLSVLALGYSASHLLKFLKENPNLRVTAYIIRIRDLIADITLTNGLNKSTSEILTIFALRNAHGFSNVDREDDLVDGTSTTLTASEIADKYKDII